MPTIEETINTLKDMGFPEEKAKKALNKTGWSGVEAAMEWLLNHPDDDGTLSDTEMPDAEPEQPKPQLTEEEKKKKLEELEELRIKKRKEREEKEKQEDLDREKKRMEDGKAISKLRQELNDQEIKKIAEERKREKMEAAEAKRRVLEQIEADKRARQMEREAAKKGVEQPPAAQAQPPPVAAPKRNYDEAKIQIRLQDGKKLEQIFKAKEPLSAVRVFVQMNRPTQDTTPIKLMTTFPKKVFSEEDYEKPLDTLGLCPSAVIILSK